MRPYPAIADSQASGSDGKPLRAPMEWDNSEGCPIGRDPRSMSVIELEELGLQLFTDASYPRQVSRLLLRQSGRVRRCGMINCPNWAYRLGHDPWRPKPGRDAGAVS